MAMYQKGDRVRVRGENKLGEVLGTVLTPGSVATYLVKLDDGTTGQYIEPLLELQPKKPGSGSSEDKAR